MIDFTDLKVEETATKADHTPEQQQEFKRIAKSKADAKKTADRIIKEVPSNDDYEVVVVVRPKSKTKVDSSFWTLQLSAIRRAAKDPEAAATPWSTLLKQVAEEYPYRVEVPDRPYHKISRPNLKTVKSLLSEMGIRYHKELIEPPRLMEKLLLWHTQRRVEELELRDYNLQYGEENGTLQIGDHTLTPDSRGRYRIRKGTRRLELPQTHIRGVTTFIDQLEAPDL